MNGLDVLRDLHPPRLPEPYATLGWPEVLAAFGLGLLLALALFHLIRPALARRPPARIEPELHRLRALPEAERLLAQARLLHRLGGQMPADLRGALYGRAPAADSAAQMEPLIRAAFRSARRAGRHV